MNPLQWITHRARTIAWPVPGRLGARAPAGELTAVSLDAQPALVRVRALPGADAVGAKAWELVHSETAQANEEPLAALQRWRRAGSLPRRGAVLVLGGAQRHVLTLDKPAVPDAEQAQAARWPLAEAMEAEADELLATAIELKAINDSGRLQVLAVGARVSQARAQLALLAQAGARVEHIDIADSALRGLALAHARPDGGTIVLFTLGEELVIGLFWQGEFCAVRSLPIPAREARGSAAWIDQLAVQVQRTADHYERQATRLAVREMLACLPQLEPHERETLCSAVSLPTREIPPLRPRAAATAAAAPANPASDEATAALAWTAVARLISAEPALREKPAGGLRDTPAAVAAAALAAAAAPAAGADPIDADTAGRDSAPGRPGPIDPAARGRQLELMP